MVPGNEGSCGGLGLCPPRRCSNPSASLHLQGEPDPPEPMRVGDLGECFFPLSNTAVSSGPENFLCEMETISFNPVRSWLKRESSQGERHLASSPQPWPRASPSEGARWLFLTLFS